MTALASADRRALHWLRTRGHRPAVERAARRYTTAGENGALWIALALAGSAYDQRRSRRYRRAGLIAVPAALWINFAVKVIVRRPRPQLPGLPPLARAPRTYSFPSGHAATAFAGAFALGPLAPALRPALVASACAMALTRPYLGVHYPADVLAGAALGTLIGRAHAAREADPA